MDWLKSGQELLGTVSKSSPSQASSLSNSEIAGGLKDALRVGTETVVGKLGQADGFNADSAIHIPLPESMRQVKTALSAVGMSAMMDDLELKLNRAAEAATPPAKKLFWNSIEAMTLDDVQTIYNGPADSATRYFEGKMSDPLAAAMQPIVEQSLNQVGAVQAYDAVMGQYATLPFVPNVKADLNSYVVDKGMQGIFHYLAIEEAAIRQNPVKRTTDILQKVFGTQ
ncbi:MAG: DUF4197 domain-containing protein [Desulfuromonadales bacterium]|nr:DUF4197 domain-containing protein [Desulfuromonadales bacterium]